MRPVAAHAPAGQHRPGQPDRIEDGGGGSAVHWMVGFAGRTASSTFCRQEP